MAAGSKRDRVARLLKLILVLSQESRGLRPKQIAELCDVSVRTVYRDLNAIDQEFVVPLWEESGRYGIVEDYFLKPLRLSLDEGMALFLAARLVNRYADERHPHVENAFLKLAQQMPAPIKRHLVETVEAIAERPHNPAFARALQVLARAWAESRQVRIWYRWTSPHGSVTRDYQRDFDPYFVEPLVDTRSCYVIGYDHYSREMRTQKSNGLAGSS